MNDFWTGVTALWVPMLAGGLLFLAACAVVTVRDALRRIRPNPFLAPWTDRKPGDLS